jgi:hypothetical protein
MPKIEMHAPFTIFSGTVGQLVYQKVRGRTIVAMKPDPDRPLSEKKPPTGRSLHRLLPGPRLPCKTKSCARFPKSGSCSILHLC